MVLTLESVSLRSCIGCFRPFFKSYGLMLKIVNSTNYVEFTIRRIIDTDRLVNTVLICGM